MRPNLAVLRAAVAPMLTEHGVVERFDGFTTDEYGSDVPSYVTVYDGPVLVRPEPAVEIQIGAVTSTQNRYDVTFPADAPVDNGHVLTVGTVTAQPALSGAKIRITDAPLDAWAVARFCKGETF